MKEGAACQAADSIPPSISDLLKSHTIKEKCRCCIYLFEMCRLVTGGEISRVGVIGCSSLCPHNIDTRHLLLFHTFHFYGRRMVKGGELKEQTTRRRPLTDLTSVIRVLQCQHTNQIKMNGAYPGHWRLASLGPISSAPVTVHIERLIERPTMLLCEEETQTHTNRFPVDGRGGVIIVLRDRKNSTSEGGSTLMPN